MMQISSKILTIHSELRREITSRKWQVGDKLPTDAEFARRFGCSTGTVNKAMASLAHEGFVERKTGAGTRVIRTAAESRSQAAQLDAYAFIYPGEEHKAIWRTVSGFQEAALEKKRRIVTLSSGLNFQKEMEVIRRLAEFDVLGAVVYSTAISFDDLLQFGKALAESPFPIITTNYPPPGLDIPSVHGDCFHAGLTATRHLLDKGLKRIGFLANNSTSTSMRRRYQGYRWALEEAGITPEKEWIFLDPAMHPNFENPLEEPAANARAYWQQMGGNLEGVCTQRFLAAALLEEALKNGARVPEDLKIISIGEEDSLPPHLPGITAYQTPGPAVGAAAFELLDNLVRKVPLFDREVVLRGEIVIRESS